MENKNAIADLKESIRLLEKRQAYELELVKVEFKIAYESLRPANLIKHTLKEITSAPDFKEDVLDTTISIAAGYLSKRIAIGSTNNPFKQLLGTLLQMGVTSLVSKNTDQLKSVLNHVVKSYFPKKDTSE